MKLLDCKIEAKIKSGDIIIIRADDPVNRLPPSEQLLRIQWVLDRIVALSGAAVFWISMG